MMRIEDTVDFKKRKSSLDFFDSFFYQEKNEQTKEVCLYLRTGGCLLGSVKNSLLFLIDFFSEI